MESSLGCSLLRDDWLEEWSLSKVATKGTMLSASPCIDTEWVVRNMVMVILKITSGVGGY